MKTISKPAALRLDHHTTARSAGFSYQRHVARPLPLFAAPSADLLTLVIAEAIKRKAQAEIQRDVLRESIYEIPVAPERNRDRGADIYPSDPDDCA
ncbi:hypothetical protein [Paraburkholderia fungorum]|uniref:Uncharacterized protein n=1 Tax=Paraburkholderia fungorum TaxID=134537 RepID=A0A3R7LAR2_9BURK|nr:hypothetical protein [Paraburkholderia fungorum]RKF46117.1 hypothetical protein BCY88_24835 [Paraburkholderia fungorum]